MTQFLQPSPPATLAETLSVIDAVLASLAPRLPPHVSLEDLASAGKLALVEAMLRFDGPVCEARAYCYVRVRGAVLDELRRLDPLSRQARARVRHVRATIQALERLLGRAPNDCEVATAAGLSIAQLRHIELLAAAASHCHVAGSGADASDGCEIVDEITDTPAGSAESRDVAASVREALSRLPANHARVLCRYYLEDATLDQIAAEMGISKERVRQIREAGEKRLRSDFVVLALWQSFLNHI